MKILLILVHLLATTFAFRNKLNGRGISKQVKASTAVSLAPTLAIRGGSSISFDIAKDLPRYLLSSPDNLFNGMFVGLFSTAAIWKVIESSRGNKQDKGKDKPTGFS